jgi:RHS repeat-associated protein
MNRHNLQYQSSNPLLALSEVYRYGFQGQEEDQELCEGAVSYKYRVEDARLGRFFSADPLSPKYPFFSPYTFSGNRIIDSRELEGLEPDKNPEQPSAPEVAGMTIVSAIANGAQKHYESENPNSPKKAPNFSGNMSTSGTAGELYSKTENDMLWSTDTQLLSATKFNMWVSNQWVLEVNEGEAIQFENYEAYVVAVLMRNFVNGSGPENYEFPENGIISSRLTSSAIVTEAIKKYKESGEQGPTQHSFGMGELADDLWENETLYTISGLVGSGTVTVTPTEEGIDIVIFNITSLTSGTFGKELFEEEDYPRSYVRNPDEPTNVGTLRRIVPFGNISQTFRLSLKKGTY